MSTAKNIQSFPIKPSIFITVFRSWKSANFKISRMLPGTICNGNAISTEFSNKDLRFPDHQMIGHLENPLFEKRIQKFFKEIGYEYQNSSATEALIEYLNSQGYPTESKDFSINRETVWVIIPKPYKQPKGTKFTNIFTGLFTPEFKRGEQQDLELTVYMTPITEKVKEITFRVDIPDYIYDKCMEDPDVDARPTKKYIESNMLSVLHSEMQKYDLQALSVEERKRNSEKFTRKLAIIFNSIEHSERDNYNHSYMGQNITTKFQWYTLYEYTNGWGRKEYFSWKKKHSNHFGPNAVPNVDGIIDYEKKGLKAYFHGTPPGIMIDWTQEREDFLVALEENFRKLSNNLNDFLSDLNTEKLDRLIATSALKLLGTNNQ